MSWQVHTLAGCAPVPLSDYLKAVGILRLVVSQGADPEARGCWRDEQFLLLTRLPRADLEHFFLERYQPTPLLAPWNGGSGFFRAGDPGLAPVEASTAPRLARLREGIAAARSLLDRQSEAYSVVRAVKARTKTDKTYQDQGQRELLRASSTYRDCLNELRTQAARPDLAESRRAGLAAPIATVESMVVAAPPPTRQESERLKESEGYRRLLAAAERRYKALKDDLLPDCRRSWRGGLAEWFAAAAALDGGGSAVWPSLLGTGGNDGRLDFTNNFLQRLSELFLISSEEAGPAAGADELLANALWATPSNRLGDGSVGQFQPAGAGGANSSNGAMGSSMVNPWDYVLMMEGTVLFRLAATRRLDPNSFARVAAPFAMRSHAAGYASPGNEKSQRGEQWLPLWRRPVTLGEVTALFGEARIQVGPQTASRPVEAARAIGRLGAARGVSEFVRYGYLERNGLSTLAVPLGRMEVRETPRSQLFDDLSVWMDRLRRLARAKTAPGRLVHAERQLADSVMAAVLHESEPGRWHSVLLAAVDVERLQATGCAIEAGPIPRLRAEWIDALGGGPDVGLALALGSAAAGWTREGRPIDPVRHHWLPLEKGARRFRLADQRLVQDPRVVMNCGSALADCCALLERRLIEGAQNGRRSLPLMAAPGYGARPDDLARLLNFDVDLERVLALGRACMALRWQEAPPRREPRVVRTLPEAWVALRLALLPWALRDKQQIPAEVALVRKLMAGNSGGAVTTALGRLRAAGMRPPLQAGITDAHSARLWAAALAFPISKFTAAVAAESLDPSRSTRT